MRLFLSAFLFTALSGTAYAQDHAPISDDQLQARIDAALYERQQAALRGGEDKFDLPLHNIPLYEGQAEAQASTHGQGLSQSHTQHRVTDGDTLYGLSKRYNIAIAEIQQANGMTDYNLALGQTLRMPVNEANRTIQASHRSDAQSANPVSTHVEHSIQSGDTLFAIARHYCLKPADLMAANPGIDPNALRIGAQVNVPRMACDIKTAVND